MSKGITCILAIGLLALSSCQVRNHNVQLDYCAHCHFFAVGDTLEWEWSDAEKKQDELTLIIDYAFVPEEAKFTVTGNMDDDAVAEEVLKAVRAQTNYKDSYRIRNLVRVLRNPIERPKYFWIKGKLGPTTAEAIPFGDKYLDCGLTVNVVQGSPIMERKAAESK